MVGLALPAEAVIAGVVGIFLGGGTRTVCPACPSCAPCPDLTCVGIWWTPVLLCGVTAAVVGFALGRHFVPYFEHGAADPGRAEAAPEGRAEDDRVVRRRGPVAREAPAVPRLRDRDVEDNEGEAPPRRRFYLVGPNA